MYPILLSIGPIQIHSFSVLAIAAMFAGMWVGRSEARRRHWNVPSFSRLVVHCTLVGFLGGHILYALTRLDLPWDQWWEKLFDFRYGFVWYGGFFASWILCFFYARKHKIAFLDLSDVAALIVVMAQAVGRIGCFLNGCCYGIPTTLPWGMPLDTPEYGHTTVHPTMLYEMLYLLLVFAFLWKGRIIRVRGEISSFYLILAPLGRFLIEFFRGDTIRGFVMGSLSTSQFIAMFTMVAGIFLLIWLKTRSAPITQS